MTAASSRYSQPPHHYSNPRSSSATGSSPQRKGHYSNYGSTRPPTQVYTRGNKANVVVSRDSVASSSIASSYDVSLGSYHNDPSNYKTPQIMRRRSKDSRHSLPEKQRSRNQTRDDDYGNRGNGYSTSRRPRRTVSTGPSERRIRSNSMQHNPQYPVKPYQQQQHYNHYHESDSASVNSAPQMHRGEVPFKPVPINKPLRDDSPTRQQEQTKHHVKMTRRVVDELHRSQGAAERRIAAVTNACEVFDHNDENRHNIELYHGAAGALAKLLLSTHSDDESRMILSALEMVFRGNPKQATSAFGKSGSNFLPTMLRLLDRFETRNMKYADISILNISKITYYISRSSELRASMCRQQGMLQALARVSTRPLNPDCRLLRVRIIANLANCEENKVIMYEQGGITDSLLRIAHKDSNDLARQLATTSLMEFSSAPANQVSMARNDTLLATLVKMILVEKSAITRESAITALQNLAFTKENRNRLVSFKDEVVLEALKKALANDQDPKARRRSAGALTNLVCEETAERMGNHKGLLETLAVVSTKDDNLEVQTRSSLALTKIASSITVKMSCHEAVLDALVAASLSNASNSVTAVFRVKARVPENREALARHTGVIDTLADICISDGSQINDKDNCIRAIMHLINEDKNRKIMCSKTILDALIKAANYSAPELAEARDSSVRAIERLATEVTNRHFMAHHVGLLVAVSKAVEREAQWEQEGRESEYGYLAKPLLMSLLVAM